MSSEKIKQTFIMDFDDLALDRPGLELLIELKEHYPDFKCTCFTQPFSVNLVGKRLLLEGFKKWFKAVKKLDWIEIAPHGFAHQRGEWQLTSKKQAETIINIIEGIFASLDVKPAKIFKFPFWEGNPHAEEVLNEKGYTLAIDRNNPVVSTDIPTYIYNWSIDEPIPKYHTIKGHGHVDGTNNGINVCFQNLLRIPTDVEFKTIGEFLNE